MSQDLIQKYYIGFYGRPADPDGLQYWQQQLEQGDDRSSMLEKFANSDEAKEFVFQDPDTGQEYTNEELVDNIYQNLFGRQADAEGRQWYAERLDSGEIEPITVVERIMDGAQDGKEPDETVLQNKLEVAEHFTQNVEGKEYGQEQIQVARSVLEGRILDSSETKAQAEKVIQDLPESNQETTLEDLSGTYKLTEFTVEYDNGLTLTDEDIGDYSGELIIYESGYAVQDVMIEGESFSYEQPIGIIDNSTILTEQQGQEYTLGYEYDDPELITYAEDIPFLSYDEVDYWQKISEDTPDPELGDGNSNTFALEDIAGEYELTGFVSNPYYGHITEDDVSSYYGSLCIQEDGEYSLYAEAVYNNEEYWVAGEGYINEINDNSISVYSYYDGNAELDYEIFNNKLLVTLGDGFSGDEYIQTYEFVPVDNELRVLGVSSEEGQSKVDAESV